MKTETCKILLATSFGQQETVAVIQLWQQPASPLARAWHDENHQEPTQKAESHPPPEFNYILHE